MAYLMVFSSGHGHFMQIFYMQLRSIYIRFYCTDTIVMRQTAYISNKYIIIDTEHIFGVKNCMQYINTLLTHLILYYTYGQDIYSIE